jgi:hypothetical protein
MIWRDESDEPLWDAVGIWADRTNTATLRREEHRSGGILDMNPRTAEVWAGVSLVTLILLSLLNAYVAVAISGLLFVVGASLHLMYRHQKERARRQGLTVPPVARALEWANTNVNLRRWEQQNAPDSTVVRTLLIAGAVPTVISVGMSVIDHAVFGAISYAASVTAVAIALAGLSATIYLSNLIDWYYVLPKLSGLVCPPPCRSSSNQKWRTVARRWYANRWATTVACLIWGGVAIAGAFYYLLFGSLKVGAGAAAVQWAGSIATSFTGLLTITLLVGSRIDLYLYLAPIFNPSFGIGDLVEDQTESPARASLFNLRARPSRPLYYVVDVSLQGAKVKRVTGNKAYGGEVFGPNKGTIMKYASATNPQRFEGCSEECSGVNWYCDNNVREDRYRG